MSFWACSVPSFPLRLGISSDPFPAAARGGKAPETGTRSRKKKMKFFIFFFSNCDFAACERHRKELWGGLSTNPQKKKTNPHAACPRYPRAHLAPLRVLQVPKKGFQGCWEAPAARGCVLGCPKSIPAWIPSAPAAPGCSWRLQKSHPGPELGFAHGKALTGKTPKIPSHFSSQMSQILQDDPKNPNDPSGGSDWDLGSLSGHFFPRLSPQHGRVPAGEAQ